jgi:hypothetical protein
MNGRSPPLLPNQSGRVQKKERKNEAEIGPIALASCFRSSSPFHLAWPDTEGQGISRATLDSVISAGPSGFEFRRPYVCSNGARPSVSATEHAGDRRRPSPSCPGLRRALCPRRAPTTPGVPAPSLPFLLCKTEHPNPKLFGYLYPDRIWSDLITSICMYYAY